MFCNEYDTWGPCTPEEAEAIAAGMYAARREVHSGGFGDGTPDQWSPEPEAWEQEPEYWDYMPEVREDDMPPEAEKVCCG